MQTKPVPQASSLPKPTLSKSQIVLVQEIEYTGAGKRLIEEWPAQVISVGETTARVKDCTPTSYYYNQVLTRTLDTLKPISKVDLKIWRGRAHQ